MHGALPSQAEPAPARPSATVILVRDGPTGLEMFLVRRHELSGFANLAYVFPGGSVIPSDSTRAAELLSPSFTSDDAWRALHERGDVAPDDPMEALTYWVAAARELLEEAGVLLHDGERAPTAADIARARMRTLDNADDFASAVRSLEVALGLEQLAYFSHWRTPVQSPKRYDTRFFVAAMPDRQEASHCNIETTDSLWISPREALARGDAHELRLVYATRAHIQRILPHETVSELLEFARAKPIRCVDPLIQPDRSVYIDPDVLACW